MWNLLWPVLVVVASNTAYHICAKSMPENANSFVSLFITYIVAAACSLAMFFLSAPGKSLGAEFTRTNWTAWVLGIAIVGLEFGFLCLYRAGWKVSIGSLVCSMSLACVLAVVGLLLYRESLNLRQLIGIGVCALGLVLVAK